MAAPVVAANGPLTHVLLTYVLPICGILCQVALYAASLPAVCCARVLRTLDGLDAVTLALQLVTAMASLEYATAIGDPFLWWSNAPGALLGSNFFLRLSPINIHFVQTVHHRRAVPKYPSKRYELYTHEPCSIGTPRGQGL